MHKIPIKARFLVVSPRSSVKPLAKTITSEFQLFYKQTENYIDKCRFFVGVNTFRVEQNTYASI